MPSLENQLDKILGKHSVHFNYSKAETKTMLLKLFQEWAESCVPKAWSEDSDITGKKTSIMWAQTVGYNKCRTQTIKNIRGNNDD